MPSHRKQDRHASQQLSLLVDMNNPDSVFEEVKIIFLDMFDKGEMSSLVAVFDDVVSLFQGRFPGYKVCDTPYHNLKHTTDVFLAMARLIHGAHTQGITLNATDVNIGLLAALMHDSGYIQKESERYESGATLSADHVQRGIVFMQNHLSKNGSPTDFINRCKTMIQSTDLGFRFDQNTFDNDADKILCRMIAASDLLAQTADRNYLEKLPLLFQEFREAGVHTHENAFGLIKEAPRFNDFMMQLIARELGGVDRYMRSHFLLRWDINMNMYQEAIDRTMAYLAVILMTGEANYRTHLRRMQGLH